MLCSLCEPRMLMKFGLLNSGLQALSLLPTWCFCCFMLRWDPEKVSYATASFSDYTAQSLCAHTQTLQVEPALALDAGAGLKQMVALEREQMRQQLGLSKGAPVDSGSGSSTVCMSCAHVCTLRVSQYKGLCEALVIDVAASAMELCKALSLSSSA
jgi:hypothetical protein